MLHEKQFGSVPLTEMEFTKKKKPHIKPITISFTIFCTPGILMYLLYGFEYVLTDNRTTVIYYIQFSYL